MSNDNGNKLAYPFAPDGYEPEFGLTKREYIANDQMKALIIASNVNPEDMNYKFAAKCAIRAADALLAALEAGDE